MVCTYTPEGLSFDCLREIISKVRNKELNVELVRMVLKQLDEGLALIGEFRQDDPDISLEVVQQGTEDNQLEVRAIQLELALEQFESHGDVSTQRLPILEIIAILRALYELLEPILKKK